MKMVLLAAWLTVAGCAGMAGNAAGQVPGQPESRTLSPDDLLSRAEERYNAADLDSSLAGISRYLALPGLTRTQRVDGLLLRAYCYTARREENAAKRAIREAWEVKPDLVVNPDRVPPRFMWLYYDVMKEAQVQEPPRTLAVLYFTNNSTTDHAALDPLSQGIADIIVTDLQDTASNVRLVERERLDYILHELEIEKSEAFDQGSAVRVGKQLGVHYLLLGSFMRLGEQVRIDYRLVKTETSELLKGNSVKGKMSSIMNLIDQLARKVAKEVGGAVTRSGENHAGVNLDALMKYSEGLDLMDEERYLEARNAFQAALSLAPDFELAKNRIMQLNPVAQYTDANGSGTRQN
jgi:TolB-like protein